MSDIVKIVIIGICGTIFSIILKKDRPEFSLILSVCASFLIFMLVVPYLESFVLMAENITNQAGIKADYIKIMFKIIGISYLVQFGAELCRDCGENSLATKIEMGGKAIILSLTLPVIYQIFDIVSTVLNLW